MKNKACCYCRIWFIAPLFGVIFATLGSPAYAHDPLEDDSEQEQHHHKDHHDEYSELNASNYRRDVAAARELVLAFRETGDDQSLDEAWELLEPAVKSATSDSESLVAAAFVAQSRHQFDYALRLINRSLAINTSNDEAWLLRASIHLVRGEADEASAACSQLRDVPPIVVLTCKARVALASGDHHVALLRLTAVLDIADAERLPADLLAWTFSVAGDLAVADGAAQQALELYRSSLGLAERTQVRAALVDVLLSEGDYDAARRSLESGTDALPLLVRQLIVAKKLDRLATVQPLVAKIQLEFEAWITDKDWLHAREMARFFLDVVERPDLARRLALINLELQQEPEDCLLERRTRPEVVSYLRTLPQR